MAFADMFNGFTDKLNTGLTNMTGTPLGQLGINMLMNSGYQRGDPSFGARLGQSAAGMMDMQQQQAQMQQTQALRQAQAQELQLRMAKAKQQQDQQSAMQQYVQQHPEQFAGTPLAAAVLGMGGGVKDATAMQALNPPPKVGTMPFERQQVNPDGTVQPLELDRSTMSYKPAGPVYTPTAQQSVDLQRQQNSASLQNKDEDQAMAQQRMEMEKQGMGVTATNAETARMEAARKNQQAMLKNNIALTDLQSGYTGVTKEIDDVIKDGRALLAKPGFDGNFGANSLFPNKPGGDTANAKADMEKFMARAGLRGVGDLKAKGIILNPMTEMDRDLEFKSILNLDPRQGADNARKAIGHYLDTLDASKQEMGKTYNKMSALYNNDMSPKGAQATVTRTGTTADGRKVIQYSDGRIEYGN